MENAENTTPSAEVPLPSANGVSSILEQAKKALTPPVIPQVGQEAAPAPARRIDEADRLAIENIYLRMQVLQQRLLILDHQKNETALAMKELQGEMETKRKELSTKYGVEINQKSIDKNGFIVGAKP